MFILVKEIKLRKNIVPINTKCTDTEILGNGNLIYIKAVLDIIKEKELKF